MRIKGPSAEGDDDDDAVADKGSAVYSHLKKAIVSRRVRPGAHLIVKEVARRLLISTTLVQQAFIRFVDEGLIERRAGYGFFSKVLDKGEFNLDYDVARMKERYAISTAIDRFSPDGLTGLSGLNMARAARWMSDETIQFYTTLIGRLHLRIGALPGNPFLVKEMTGFVDRTTFIRQIDLQDPARFERVIRDTSELVEALSERDTGRALANLDGQFRRKTERLDDLIKEANARSLNEKCTIGPIWPRA